jgi:hypothetical protein
MQDGPAFNGNEPGRNTVLQQKILNLLDRTVK